MNLRQRRQIRKMRQINCAYPENVICIDYTMRQKCVLARTFLQSRQCRSRAKHGEASAAKGCPAALPAVIIPQIQANPHEFAATPANSQNAADQLHLSGKRYPHLLYHFSRKKATAFVARTAHIPSPPHRNSPSKHMHLPLLLNVQIPFLPLSLLHYASWRSQPAPPTRRVRMAL